MKIKLIKIEDQLKHLIEGNTNRLFPSQNASPDLVTLFIEALETGVLLDPQQRLVGPNLYSLLVNPDQAQVIRENHSLLEGLCLVLSETAKQAGIVFNQEPVIRVISDAKVATGHAVVIAEHSQANLVDTNAFDKDVINPEASNEDKPLNAFLVIDGIRTYNLTETVINIGRKETNQIVLDDPAVSRQHAQIRLIKGKYVIFDLESMSGILVNGKPAHQHSLSPGDVIILGSTPLVYGQDKRPGGTTQILLPDQSHSHTNDN